MARIVLTPHRLLAALLATALLTFAMAAAGRAGAVTDGPVITSLSPAFGPPAGGTTVTLTGSGLTGATGVTFGTVPAASFTDVSDSQVTAVSPPEPAGVVQVTVTTPAGTASASFVYTPIQHVVVIYEENHSFDNVLGYWCDQIASGQIARADGCPDGGMPASVRLSDGTVIAPSVTKDIVPAVQHNTADQALAIDGGKMDGWELIQGCSASYHYRCVSGYQPSHIPNVTALATRFAISDATHSMQDSPSAFGHLYVAATTDGFTGNNPPTGSTPGKGWGCDSGKKTTWQSPTGLVKAYACVPDPNLTMASNVPLANGGAYGPTPVPWVPTIMDRLDAASLPWRIYGAQCTSETLQANGTELCSASNGQYVWSICPQFAGCLYSPQDQNLVPDAQFTSDASSGTLPAFSIVTPGDFTVSEHNGASMAAGDNWIGQLVSAVENGPAWSSTAIFITWDDCGCFYDQVPPGVNPDGTPQGPRVPLVIVSPYARPGFTDTTPTTFAGILGFTEQNFGLPALGVNDAGAYPFTNAFDYGQAPLRPVRMVTRPVPASEHVDWAQAREGS